MARPAPAGWDLWWEDLRPDGTADYGPPPGRDGRLRRPGRARRGPAVTRPLALLPPEHDPERLGQEADPLRVGEGVPPVARLGDAHRPSAGRPGGHPDR